MRYFEWCDEKNKKNLEKHSISFDVAQEIFYNPTIDMVDKRFDYNEIRIKSIGIIDDVVVIVVIHTDRSGITRLISARKASKDEREIYYQAFYKGDSS